MTVSSELGLEDGRDLFELYLPQGRVRLNTHAMVSDYRADSAMEMDGALHELLAFLGAVDIAFMGTNGIYEGVGFTTHDRSEARTKATMIESAKCCLVLADSSKFGLRQEQVFAGFDQRIEIVTAATGEFEHLVRRYSRLFDGTTTSVTIA
jgi:DeoR family fructose operon transcriptional repressor